MIICYTSPRKLIQLALCFFLWASTARLKCLDTVKAHALQSSLCCPRRLQRGAAGQPQEWISHPLLRLPSLPHSTHLSTGDPGEGRARLGGAGLARGYGQEGCLPPRPAFYWGVVLWAQCWLQVTHQKFCVGSALILGLRGDFNRDLLPIYCSQHPAQPKLLCQQWRLAPRPLCGQKRSSQAAAGPHHWPPCEVTGQCGPALLSKFIYKRRLVCSPLPASFEGSSWLALDHTGRFLTMEGPEKGNRPQRLHRENV